MLWGTFGIVHIATLLLSASMITALYFILRKSSERVQTLVLGILSFTGIAAIIFNLVTWNSPLEYLPLHLCSLSAMVLPFAVFTRSRVLNNLLLLWGLGAILAIVVNTAQANYQVFSLTFAFYYFPHTFEFGVVLLMFLLGRVKLDPRCIGSTLAITFLAYTAAHFINLAVNDYCATNEVLDWAGNVVKVNYMYSLVPENPIFALFYSICPYEFWYVLLSMPIIIVYLAAIYAKQILRGIKERKNKEHRS